MIVSILTDASWETKIDHACRPLDESDLLEFFDQRDYGPGVAKLLIVATCRSDNAAQVQRISFNRKNRMLGMDIMLDYAAFVSGSHAERRKMLLSGLLCETAAVLQRRRIPDFDRARFLDDWTKKVTAVLTSPDAARWDPLCLERATGFDRPA
jgi:hypothetical protein